MRKVNSSSLAITRLSAWLLVILGLTLAARASVDASACLMLGSVAATFSARALLGNSPEGTRTSLLSGTVFGLAAWMIANDLLFGFAYSPVAPYHAAILLVGLFLGRQAGRERLNDLFAGVLLLSVPLAAWALSQRVEGFERAAAGFRTPATLAVTLNLVLLPVLVAVATSRRRILPPILACLLAGVLATTSRGGWIALGAGALFGIALARRLKLQAEPGAARRLAFAVAMGLALWWLTGVRVTSHPHIVGPEAGMSLLSRLGLYDLALRTLSVGALPTGSGYLSFHYAMDAAGDTVPGFVGIVTTDFVHNDYLQMLLELGVPGLAGLLAIVALPLGAAWRTGPSLDTATPARAVLVAASSGLASMAVHALIDFPFYVPICVLTYGIGLGLVDAVLPHGDAQGRRYPAWMQAGRRVAVAAVGAVAAWLLIVPAAAELAAGHAATQWAAGSSQSAAYWFEVARRLQPRDWRYHWEAGRFWFIQAAVGDNRSAAELADRAFALGYEANPREVRNLTARISLHRQLRSLLPAPADAATLRAWADRAVALAPANRRALAVRLEVMNEFGAGGGSPK